MKLLITTMKNNDDKKIVSTQFLSEETENIKHELIELAPLPEKEGYTQELVYDKESKSYKLYYVEIPKSETEKLREELEMAKGSIVELTQMIAIAGGE